MLDILKKNVTEQTKNVDIFQSPVTKREKQLERSNKILLFIIFVLILILGVVATLAVIMPKPLIVVDRETGEIIGEYQTSAYRTNDELLGGAKRFLQYHLSFNADTVYDDFATAMNMMTDELKRKRFKYLKDFNVANEIVKAKSKSTLSFDTVKIISKNQNVSFVEVKGDLIFLAGSTKDKRVPFHFILTLQNTPVSSLNTSGVKVIDYEEKEVRNDENASK